MSETTVSEALVQQGDMANFATVAFSTIAVEGMEEFTKPPHTLLEVRFKLLNQTDYNAQPIRPRFRLWFQQLLWGQEDREVVTLRCLDTLGSLKTWRDAADSITLHAYPLDRGADAQAARETVQQLLELVTKVGDPIAREIRRHVRVETTFAGGPKTNRLFQYKETVELKML